MALSDSGKKLNKKVLLFIIALIVSMVWLIPIIFLFVIPFKTTADYASSSFFSLPQSFGLFESFSYAWDKANIGRPFLNSILYVVVSSTLTVLLSSLAAYAIVKLKLKGSFFIYILIWSGMIVPIQIFLIPLLKAYYVMGLYNTQIGLIIVYTALSLPFSTFVFRSYFYTIPAEFQEAAKIDGCSDFQIYWRIIIPNSKMVLMALFVISFLGKWNEFLWPLLVMKSQTMETLTVGIAGLGGTLGVEYNDIMAGSILGLIPIFILFVFLSKYISKGLKMRISF